MVDVSIQPWSAVWRLPTIDGNVLIKQTTAARRHEGTVQQFCASIAPDYVDSPLAIDASSGRILLEDAGPTLHDTDYQTEGLPIDSVIALVADYADFQIATIGHDELAIDTGIPLWDPARAIHETCAQGVLLNALPLNDPRHITAEQLQRVQSKTLTIDQAATRLTASPVPSCLDHGDLWPGNVLPPGRGRQRHRFIDFGDAAWTHPFLSMMMLIVECRHQWAIPELPQALNLDHPLLRRMIDAYLEPWTVYAPMPELRSTLSDALRLAPVRRSRAWITNLDGADPAAFDQDCQMPWVWLHDVGNSVSW